MLSASKAIGVDQAQSYYVKEDSNYWETDSSESKFFGKNLSDFGIINRQKVDNETFQKLAQGINPKTDERILKTSKTSGEDRAGFDFTFSAPKSVSILNDVTEENIFEKLHDEAVNEALSYMEKNLSQTRTYENGTRIKTNVENLAVAQFRHHTTRSLDPSLHTHNFIFNFIKDTKGNYKAIEPKKLYENQKMLGQMYQNSLAHKVKELGYSVSWKESGGNLTFEVNGVDKEVLDTFSKRHGEVQDKYENLKNNEKYSHLTDQELMNKAVLFSRDSKQNLTKDEIQNVWKDDLEKLNISKEDLLQDVGSFKQPTVENVINKEKLIDISISTITFNKAIFKREDFLHNALKLSKGNYTLNDIQQNFDKRVTSQFLAKDKYDVIQVEKGLYTSKEILDYEQAIIRDIKFSQNSFKSISDKDIAKKAVSSIEINNYKPTENQANAVKDILVSQDQYHLVQGVAGSGKTTMLKALKELSSNSKINLVGLAATGKAASELEKESKIKSSTIDSFLQKYDSSKNLKDTILIVDEASMLGTKKFYQISKIVQEQNIRVVMIGDSNQLQAIESGSLFNKLQKEDFIKTSVMDQSLRQKTKFTKDVVNDFKDGNVRSAFKNLQDNNKLTVDSISNIKEKASQAVVVDIKLGKESAVLVNTNSERNDLNLQIKEQLQKQKIIGSKNYKFNTLKTVSLSNTDKVLSQSYKVDDVITNSKLFQNIRPNTNMKIIGINEATNKIKVTYQDQNEKNFKWIDLNKHGSKLNKNEIVEKEFSIGQKVMFEQNNSKLHIKNGEIGTIKEIDGKTLKIQKNEKLINLDIKDYKHLDHGYALTAYKAQGQSIDNTHIVADTNHQQMNSLNNAYVFASRAKEDIHLYTNNNEVLQKQFQQSEHKENAVDLIESKVKNGERDFIDIRLQNNEHKESTIDIDKVFENAKNEGRQKEPSIEKEMKL